jgi:GntR family transcriptional repressor for pyruvate dehydrogenase complex
MRASQFDAHAFGVADAQFHRAIASAAHNPVLEHLVACLHEGVVACIAATTPQPFDGSFSIELHEAIFEAISRRSVLDARRAMTTHMTFARQELQRLEKGAPRISPVTSPLETVPSEITS